MRCVLFLILFLLPLSVLAMPSYNLAVTISPQESLLKGTVVVSDYDVETGSVDFRLQNNCRILSVNQQQKKIPWVFEAGILSIELMDKTPVEIVYQGRFTDKVPVAPVHSEDPGYGVSATISSSGVYLSGSANWYPRLPGSLATYKISVETPAFLEAITSGKRLQREKSSVLNRSTWLIDYPLPSLTLAAGPYQIYEDTSGDIPIYAYFYPDSAPFAEVYLQESRKYLVLYQDLFGPYPFHKFAIVENFFPTGYGLPSWTLLGSSVIQLPFIVKTSLGHEIAHSWWGSGVRVDYGKGNWAEGLTTYVADYFFKEREAPAAGREYRLKVLSDYASLVSPENNFAVKSFMARHDKASQAIGYGKTMMIFHMLREKVGDEKFWIGLRQLAEENMFKTIDWDAFSRTFSHIAAMDLQPFFEQWLTRAQGPEIVLESVSRKRVKNGWTIEGLLIQGSPPYDIQVPLGIESTTGMEMAYVDMKESQRRFSVTVSEKPLSLEVDPEVDLFQIMLPEEIPSTVNSIRGSEDLLLITASRDTPSEKARKTLVAALRKSGSPHAELGEVTKEDLSDHDLLIFGWEPGSLPETISSQARGIFSEENSGPANRSFFLVTRNPFNNNRHAAWFVVRSSPEDAVVARKIPHYGKYSQLQFEGSQNIDKRIDTPQKTPLKVIF